MIYIRFYKLCLTLLDFMPRDINDNKLFLIYTTFYNLILGLNKVS